MNNREHVSLVWYRRVWSNAVRRSITYLVLMPGVIIVSTRSKTENILWYIWSPIIFLWRELLFGNIFQCKYNLTWTGPSIIFPNTLSEQTHSIPKNHWWFIFFRLSKLWRPPSRCLLISKYGGKANLATLLPSSTVSKCLYSCYKSCS